MNVICLFGEFISILVFGLGLFLFLIFIVHKIRISLNNFSRILYEKHLIRYWGSHNSWNRYVGSGKGCIKLLGNK